ncbi:hypothetical protein FT663_04505 [Candidozyma haemuli var. vulneris]|nr:hypothetical protein FT663_04505 [[Candida] haemuloni var. vulneris]KAF3987814.1 hypothetical protein FT662_03775 [[Candida] haemuloni var. vulneris]
MKRRGEDPVVSERPNSYSNSDDLGSAKCIKTTACRRIPPSFLEKEGIPLDSWVQVSLQQVMESTATGTSRMDMEHVDNLNFLVFLGAQGKEYIDVIRDMFPKHFDPLVFVSSNIDSRFTENPYFHCSDTETCKELARYFEIMDPLGGGNYPLNYLIVIDSDSVVRCKLPIRIGSHYCPHQKFGVSLPQLKGLIDEFLDFFMEHSITIIM